MILLPAWVGVDQHQLTHSNAVPITDICTADIVPIDSCHCLRGGLNDDANSLATQREMVTKAP
ncbi:MAG: hypothetical protein GWQ05_09160 [Verrucomicrobiaceae bacterium]|nr:hypothetical protein [Verrucomicrobiaceae bacterium]